MLARFTRDESGMAMGLAIIVVLLVGVMGAGLLVFVRNDLEAVVEVNRGQRAMDLADAGVQATKRQLLSDVNRKHYDLNLSNDCDDGDRRTNTDDWSPLTTIYNDPTNCGSGTMTRSESGATKNFAGGKFNVTIQCLDQITEGTDVCAGIDEQAPTDATPQRKFFKITSTGFYPADESGAKRKVEAIYHTVDIGIPKAYYTPSSIEVKGSACIDSISLFTLGDVTLSGGGSGCSDVDGKIKGKDLAYRYWDNSFNLTPRVRDDAGFGAVGSISSSLKVSGRDYDANTCPKFVQSLSDSSACPSSAKITFPFDPGTQTGQRDEERINFLREEAKTNGVYHPSSGSIVDVGSDFSWPSNSTNSTVVFVEYASASGTNRVDWSVGSDSDPPVKGTLVVNGGNFKMEQHKACLEGVVIVRGGVYEEGSSTDTGGNTCLDGFVNASGTIKIAGNVQSLAAEEVLERPGFYDVRQWSWRECYSEDCSE